jgi:hypothetical protein
MPRERLQSTWTCGYCSLSSRTNSSGSFSFSLGTIEHQVSAIVRASCMLAEAPTLTVRVMVARAATKADSLPHLSAKRTANPTAAETLMAFAAAASFRRQRQAASGKLALPPLSFSACPLPLAACVTTHGRSAARRALARRSARLVRWLRTTCGGRGPRVNASIWSLLGSAQHSGRATQRLRPPRGQALGSKARSFVVAWDRCCDLLFGAYDQVIEKADP